MGIASIVEIVIDAVENALEDSTENYDVLLAHVKEQVLETLRSDEYAIVETTVEMDAQKTEDGYVLTSNETFENAIYGNWQEALISVLMEVVGNE